MSKEPAQADRKVGRVALPPRRAVIAVPTAEGGTPSGQPARRRRYGFGFVTGRREIAI
jgi:hypothetical protein